jgi:hypothetical protein
MLEHDLAPHAAQQINLSRQVKGNARPAFLSQIETDATGDRHHGTVQIALKKLVRLSAVLYKMVWRCFWVRIRAPPYRYHVKPLGGSGAEVDRRRASTGAPEASLEGNGARSGMRCRLPNDVVRHGTA